MNSLASDSEQCERMQAACTVVGRDFKDKGLYWVGVPQTPATGGCSTMAPCETFHSSASVDHLDRVLAGCCWEVHGTRADSEESL